MFCKNKLSVKNKAILITGCNSGMGKCLALKMNKMGFRIYATVRDPKNIGSKELIENCFDKNRMNVIQMDVTNDKMIEDCFEFVKNDLENNKETLYALVNNAGRASMGHTNWGQIDEYYKVFDVNTFGVVKVTRKFAPLIIKSKGRIVINAALNGRVTVDNFGIHSMSKCAVIFYSDALRREMRKFKVKVSTIEAGLFKTAMVNNLTNLFEQNWIKTDPDIKQLYGEQYFVDQLKKMNFILKLGMAIKNIDKPVNDMIDAITSKHPNRRYTPVPNILFKFFPIFIPIIPQWIIDMSFIIIDNTVPDYMKN